MKMKIKEMNCASKPSLEPITFQITIESIDELVELWKRLNIGAKSIDEMSYHNCFINYSSNSIGCGVLWNILDDKLKKYGLK